MSQALRLIIGLIMMGVGILYVAAAIRDQDWGLRWRGDYAFGGSKRQRARLLTAILGIVYLISGLSSLLLFVAGR